MMHFNNNRTTKPFPFYGTQLGAPRYNKTPSKVVSIPVHFVGSERNITDSATKIQRVARGYLVRSSLKKMLKMKVELEEIDKDANNEETVMIMKKEPKVKIRIGETIMNLLLRLDSVRVFHCCALRDLRKSLIKRAIFLQEFVDQIQMASPTDNVKDGEDKCDGVEENCLEKEEVGCEEEHEGGKKIEALVSEDGEGNCVGEEVNCMEKEKGGCEVNNEGGDKMELFVNEDDGEGKCVKEENCLMKVKEEGGQDEDQGKMEIDEKDESVGTSLVEEGIEDNGVDVKEEEKNCLMKLKEEEGEDEDEKKMSEEEKEESVGTNLVEEGIEEDSVDVKEEEGRNVIGYEEEEEENFYEEEKGGNRKMLKRMMDDNEKMMYMMTQLFEKNEKQTSLLTSLTQRVEQLERAFTCDKLKKKNKRRRHVDAKNRYQ